MKRSALSLACLAAVLGLTACGGSDGKDGANGKDGVNGVDGVTTTVTTDPASGNGDSTDNTTTGGLTLEVVGRYASGSYGKSAAEIVQFHRNSNSAMAINGADNRIDVISLAGLPTTAVANAFSDSSLSSVPFNLPTEVTVAGDEVIALGVVDSLSVFDNLLAVAMASANKTDPGAVLFYTLDAAGEGTFLKAVKVGSLPDMVTFTPDGSKVLTANEGEPDTNYAVDPEGSISIIEITAGVPADTAALIDFDDMVFASALLEPADYDTDAKRRALLEKEDVKFAAPAGTTVAQDLEPEYIAVSSDSKTAYVTLQENNAMAILDLASNEVRVRGLGLKDWSQYALDYTNEDEVPMFSKVDNLFGLYQPDSIAAYDWNGATFVVTANEGDSRDYSAYSEEERAKDLDLSPEMQVIYDQNGGKDGLGRIKVTTAMGDPDGNGEYDAIYTYGARSFSIWDQNGNQVFDSGDDIGRITASVLGSNFNSAHTENKGDNRSDDKGAEPEAITVGEINGRTYAFIGLERVGGVFVYDVTNPYSPNFETYLNNRDFSTTFEMDDDLADPCDMAEGIDCTQVPNTGDLGPEGIKFISTDESPNGNPLIVVGNEVSGSVTVYQVVFK
ncbi:MAG: choice-of-anchor I family protein [Oleibacter sp.]|nr:choice-of-anchor I family protein [Thalassolituus sp.]